MIGVKSWRHLRISSLVSRLLSSFSSYKRIFDTDVKSRTTRSRALRYAFLLLVIKYTVLGSSVWRYCERKKERDRVIGVKLTDRMDTGIS